MNLSFLRAWRLPLAAVVLAVLADAALAERAQVTLSLRDADINTLIETVSQVTGKNFIVDPRVRGKVTVISSSPMDAAGVYETFLAVLEVQGFAAVPAGEAIKVIPESSARQEGGNRIASGSGLPADAYVTHAYQLQNASAAQLVTVLRPLVAQTGHLAAYSPSNMLIISDRAGNVERVERLIREIDTNGDRDTELVPLQNAGAGDVVRVLSTLQQQDKQQDPTARPATIIADERSNSVLIGGDKADRVRLLDLIKQLDQPAKQNGGLTQVIYLNYASAENLAPILQGYAQAEQSKTRAGASAGGAPGAGAAVQVSGGGGNDQSTIVADKDTNALVISAPPKTMSMLRSVIDQLDIRRKQVLVDAIVAEVSADKSSQLGIDWIAYDPSRIAAAGILNSSTLSAIQSAASSLASTSTTSTTTSSAAIAAGASILGQGANALVGTVTQSGAVYGALIKALAGDANTNILSTPSLMTLDNQEAKITVGQDVPFLTGSFSNTGVASANGSVNPFQTIDRKDVGLTLGITPTINVGSAVKLKINLENSTIASGTAGSSNLITNKRTITNTVTVQDGQILVIGGLIDDQLNDSQNKIPVLGDIPILGALFRARSVTKTKRNLMVFIHPVIVHNPEEGDYYTRVKYDAERSSQLATVKGPIPLIGGQRPMLYDYQDYLKRSNRPNIGTQTPEAAPEVAPGGVPGLAPQQPPPPTTAPPPNSGEPVFVPPQQGSP